MCRDAPCARAHACVCARACVWCVHSTLDGGTRAEPVASRARELSVGAGRLGGLAHVAENVVASEWALLLMVAMRSQCSWQTAAPRARLHKRDAACACARRHAEQDDQRDRGWGRGAQTPRQRSPAASEVHARWMRWPPCEWQHTQARERAALMRQCGVCVCARGGGGGGRSAEVYRGKCARPWIRAVNSVTSWLGAAGIFFLFSPGTSCAAAHHTRAFGRRRSGLHGPWRAGSLAHCPRAPWLLLVCAGTWAVVAN